MGPNYWKWEVNVEEKPRGEVKNHESRRVYDVDIVGTDVSSCFCLLHHNPKEMVRDIGIVLEANERSLTSL